MATVIATRPPVTHRASFFARLLDRCIRLLPYVALPGYYPASHAYHFRPGEQAGAAGAAPRRKIIRLPASPFHR